MKLFDYLKTQQSDINEHLETLKNLASECEHVTEMGVRAIVSTWAFIEGLGEGKTLISIDIKHPKDYGGDLESAEKACKEKGINFTFKEASTLDIKIDKTDLLFIDTLHTYDQLKAELALHGNKAKKYLVFHDTVSCADELMPAIEEFIQSNPHWNVEHHYMNNNGVLVLKR